MARPPSNGSSKGGKIVPSTVLFTKADCNVVGYAAVKAYGQHTQSSSKLVTSFKRVVGMTSRQATELRKSDPSFWNSLPFNALIIDDESLDNVDDKENKQFTQLSIFDANFLFF